MKRATQDDHEQRCLACNGTRFPITKPTQDGRKFYHSPEACGGKGRETETDKHMGSSHLGGDVNDDA